MNCTAWIELTLVMTVGGKHIDLAKKHESLLMHAFFLLGVVSWVLLS
jgi:hypothetical protein